MKIEIILEIVKAGLTIFTDERRRKFESGLKERLDAVSAAKMKRFPFFTNAGLAKAELELDNYLMAYSKELKDNIEQGKKNV